MLVLTVAKERFDVGAKDHDVQTANVMGSSVGTLPLEKG